MTKEKKRKRYICWGPESGWCGHLHRSPTRAEECASKHDDALVLPYNEVDVESTLTEIYLALKQHFKSRTETKGYPTVTFTLRSFPHNIANMNTTSTLRPYIEARYDELSASESIMIWWKSEHDNRRQLVGIYRLKKPIKIIEFEYTGERWIIKSDDGKLLDDETVGEILDTYNVSDINSLVDFLTSKYRKFFNRWMFIRWSK